MTDCQSLTDRHTGHSRKWEHYCAVLMYCTALPGKTLRGRYFKFAPLVSQGIGPLRLAVHEKADASQIYALGWSMGGYFSQFYVMYHHVTAGGNVLAAAGAYGAANPFADLRHNASASCAMEQIPHIQTPLYIISAGCDAMSPCSEEQLEAFDSPGNACTPWVDLLRSLGAQNVEFVILSSTGECLPVGLKCNDNIGLREHLTWPDSQMPSLLSFFRSHPAGTKTHQ